MFRSKALNEILEGELALGNTISEVSSWPPKCQKLVILAQPFHKVYRRDGVSAFETADRHYWAFEYSHRDETLACRG